MSNAYLLMTSSEKEDWMEHFTYYSFKYKYLKTAMKYNTVLSQHWLLLCSDSGKCGIASLSLFIYSHYMERHISELMSQHIKKEQKSSKNIEKKYEFLLSI